MTLEDSAKAHDDASPAEIWPLLLGAIVPPLGMFLEIGLRRAFWINLLLTCFGFIPGAIHAIWFLSSQPQRKGHNTPTSTPE